MNRKFVAALLVGVAFLVTGCGDDDKPQEVAVKMYPNGAAGIAACREDDHTEEECRSSLEGAQGVHETSAPHIPTREECVARYGIDACIERHDQSGGSWFAPAMAGFVVGHITAGMMTPHYQPVYVDRSGNAFSGTSSLGSWRSSCPDNSCRGGGYVAVPPRSNWATSYRTTTVTVTQTAPGKPAVAAPVTPTTRGGFGGSAAAIATGTVGKSITAPRTPTVGSYSAGASTPSYSAPKPSISSGSVSSGSISSRGGFGARAGGFSSGG